MITAIEASTVPHNASQEVEGAEFEVMVEPSSLTRIMATAMQIQPRQKRPPIESFWERGIWRFQIKPVGRSITVKSQWICDREERVL